MGHDIVDNQMVYTGDVPWHGLGARVKRGATSEQMLKAAKLDWNVVTVPAYAIHNNRPLETGQLAVVREDTGQCFGIGGRRYTPVQNAATVAFFDQFCKAGDLELETVGAVRGGEYVWALAKVKSDAIQIDRDVIENYLLIANSHVPGNSLVIKNTMIRVVCNNTLTASLADDSRVFGRFMHTTTIAEQMEIARFFVQAALDAQRRFCEDMGRLIETSLTDTQAAELILSAFDISPKGEKFQNIWDLYHGGQRGYDLPTVQGNAWGLLNAATEHIDHQAGRDRDSRLRSAWFGHGEAVKRRLLNALLALAG
jgi:phage/plasmid-like protein (TIGR03299 family)